MAVLRIKEIMKLLPHRQPFLLLDTVEELEPGKRAVARKCVTYNEPFFNGHFPQEPVMPGVLIVLPDSGERWCRAMCWCWKWK